LESIVELILVPAYPDRIGRVRQVIGLQLKDSLDVGAAVRWTNIERAKSTSLMEKVKTARRGFLVANKLYLVVRPTKITMSYPKILTEHNLELCGASDADL
jgi:hypothetical protein